MQACPTNEDTDQLMHMFIMIEAIYIPTMESLRYKKTILGRTETSLISKPLCLL